MKINQSHVLVCVCFSDNKMFTGYGDGLICSWSWVPKPPGMKDQKQVEMLDDPSPLFGHTNRIN